MSRPIYLTLDFAALQHNTQKFVKLRRILAIAMVKSNAYGHGLERIAKALPDVDALGVACSEEGTRLRQVGIKIRLY